MLANTDETFPGTQGEVNQRYRMPVEYGPSCGPRRGPGGITFDLRDAPRATASVSFLTDRAKLERLLPPRCALDGEPIVTVEHTTLRELQWLAGRSYSLISVGFVVRYVGPNETARGLFRSVLWENRPEPILTGREELGVPKLYSELPEPRIFEGNRHYSAIWDGHEFIRLTLTGLEPATQPPALPLDGTLYRRFMPAITPGASPSIDEMTLTPSGGFQSRTQVFLSGRGDVDFVRSTWEQLPTMYQVVNGLADLPVLETRGGTYLEALGNKDLGDTRLLT